MVGVKEVFFVNLLFYMVKMKVMIFINDSNFKANIRQIYRERNQDRIIDFYKIHKFVLDYLSKNPQYENKKLSHVRTYLYTGEYTYHLLKKIKTIIKRLKEEKEKTETQKLLEELKKRKQGQRNFFQKANTYNFFEIKKKPLQFSEEKSILQKGIDVQIAVDLVSNAYLNNYDVSVLFSGDIDLLESLRLIKNLGKHIVIISHYKNIAKEIMKESDLFIDLQKVNDDILDKFSHIFEK